mmetsp:Transcript_16060/g.32309  ORF Transcript_16060/g.32309 Transcript_16060/m.32309 type:complete len:200 (+) Transcript_16060:1613-2212(+)
MIGCVHTSNAPLCNKTSVACDKCSGVISSMLATICVTLSLCHFFPVSRVLEGPVAGDGSSVEALPSICRLSKALGIVSIESSVTVVLLTSVCLLFFPSGTIVSPTIILKTLGNFTKSFVPAPTPIPLGVKLGKLLGLLFVVAAAAVIPSTPVSTRNRAAPVGVTSSPVTVPLLAPGPGHMGIPTNNFMVANAGTGNCPC